MSVGTVSNVLNNVKTVKEENRIKINDTVRKLKYKPNRIARSLSKGRTKNVGFIIPDVTNPFFPELVRGAQDFLIENDYYIVLCNSDNDNKKEENFIDDMISMWVDGILIVVADSKNQNIEIYNNITSPLVIVDRELEMIKRDLVIINNKKGPYEVVKFLIDKGHRKIVALMGPEYVMTAQRRKEGWEKAMKEHELFNAEYVTWGNFSIVSGYEMTRQMLENVGVFDAIFAGDDLIAMGSIQCLEERGYNVPDDISIAGFDDIYTSKFIKPPLTTLKQPIYKMGEIAAQLLLDRMEGSAQFEPKRIVVDGELVVRGSVKVRPH